MGKRQEAVAPKKVFNIECMYTQGWKNSYDVIP